MNNGGFYNNNIPEVIDNGDTEVLDVLTPDSTGDSAKAEPVPSKGVSYNASKDIVKIAGAIVSGLFLVLSVWVMLKSFTPAKEQENVLMSYMMTNSVDYRVNLVENTFYDKTFLGPNELIPAPFVKNIEIDFSSFMSAPQQLNVNYSYDITGELVTTTESSGEEGPSKVWSKSYRIKDTVSNTVNGSGYSVMDNVVLDYNVYSDYVDKYKLFAAIPLNASYNVTMKITAISEYNGNPINEESTITVAIPLAISTLRISTTGTGEQQKTITSKTVIPGTSNYIALAISILIFFVSAFVTYKLLKSLRKMTEEHSLLLKLNKIVRDYDQIVIEVATLPDMGDMSVIEVTGFKDMIDIQKELHVPILYSKSEVLEDNRFYIVNQNQVYKYKLNGEVERI